MRWAGVVALAGLVACTLRVDWSGSAYLCADGERCPPGFVCVEGRCLPPGGGADAGDPDGGPVCTLEEPCGCVQAVRVGGMVTCALRADDSIWCWGRNDPKTLGPGTTRWQEGVPVRVGDVADAGELVAGDGHACVRRAGGLVSCWGANDWGQRGDGADLRRTARSASIPCP